MGQGNPFERHPGVRALGQITGPAFATRKTRPFDIHYSPEGPLIGCLAPPFGSTIQRLEMTNYQIHGPARTCTATGRELKPGERVFSVLRDDAGQFVRQDYASEAWPGPPENAVAWWAGRVLEAGKRAKPVINDDLLVDCFEHLTETSDPGRLRFRYVVALLLMRRKRFKFEDASKKDDRELMVVRDVKAGRKHEIVDPLMTEPEMDSVRDEVFRVLGWE